MIFKSFNIKFHKIIFIAFILLLINNNIYAKPISIEKAKQVATNFMIQKHSFLTKDRKEFKLFKSLELANISIESIPNCNFYIFNANNKQGWVIVSGDDSIIPILAYSTNGDFDTENIAPATTEWLKHYNGQIQNAINEKLSANENISRQWLELSSKKSQRFINRSERQVYPLIKTQWNQSPYYNRHCPYDYYYAEHAVTGCVATAMAQIMNYWEYPQKGIGFHSFKHDDYGTLSANFGATVYDWDNMPNSLNSSSTTKQIDAVATLMYHCGVSVDMGYGVNESGAYIIANNSTEACAENALKSFFGYKNTLQGVEAAEYSPDSPDKWINMLKKELDASRPILYGGFSNSGGHAFICDGYDNNDYFHFNWGWGGVLDGYFSLLNHDYAYNPMAIIGIEPNDPSQQYFDLKLYSDLDIDNKFWFGNELELSVDIANYGNTTFEGNICAAVFDENCNFIDYIQIKETKIQGGYYTSNIFYNERNMAFVPGSYQVMVFYKVPNGNWIIIDDGEYFNYETFEIYYYSDIETNSDFSIASTNCDLTQGEEISINVDILNSDDVTFSGKVRLTLSNINGEFIQTIQEKEIELKPNYHYTNGLTFKGTITAEPGTYHLSIDHKRNGDNVWYYAGADKYPNPISVVVKAPALSQDKYENNNTQLLAYNLPNNWNSNTLSINTEGANIHDEDDLDYYKIILPSGYDYEITPRLFDNYTDENDYSADALFSYSINGSNYSDPYDDIMDKDITLHNGDTLYFIVSPYFQGMTGTYLLNININRKISESIDDTYLQNISIYPNPADEYINIKSDISINEIIIYDLCGRILYQEKQQNTLDLKIPTHELSNGYYLMKIIKDKDVYFQKINIKHN